jgi:DNA-binding NarL/FixJ family response regulator
MIKVAIVEDNTAFRRSLRRVIESKPEFSCAVACATGKEALENIPNHKPDVVLMDLQLPDFSGAEVTKRLKTLLPNLSIVVLTVYSDAENIFEALRAGACGYLLKRATSREILEAIVETHRGGSPMTSEIARKVITTFSEPGGQKAAAEPLAPREKEILDLLAQGYANKEIAEELSLTVGTVCWYLHEIYRKLHVQSRVQAVNKLRQS